jgi:hypothetical protein
MALEARPGGYYYYRKQRIGRRVVSVYGGGGDVAALIAGLQDLETERTAARRRQWCADRAAIEAPDAALTALEQQLNDQELDLKIGVDGKRVTHS